jgi:hypothetical protein
LFPELANPIVERSRVSLFSDFKDLTKFSGESEWIDGHIGNERFMVAPQTILRLSRGLLERLSNERDIKVVEYGSMVQKMPPRDTQAVARAFTVLPGQIASALELGVRQLLPECSQNAVHHVLVRHIDFVKRGTPLAAQNERVH